MPQHALLVRGDAIDLSRADFASEHRDGLVRDRGVLNERLERGRLVGGDQGEEIEHARVELLIPERTGENAVGQTRCGLTRALGDLRVSVERELIQDRCLLGRRQRRHAARGHHLRRARTERLLRAR
ncbi:MAG TPA: hypothetical protein VMZ53_31320 [Kofleriaceae bacterium]|nr:hypothetical protein [Kofleriaceae bacterium]